MIALDNTEEFFGSKKEYEAWITQAIWGHRLERQPLSALMLEFLGMAEGMHRQGKLLDATRPGEDATYAPNRALQLRNILFNNPRMEEILRESRDNDAAGWTQWLSAMENGASLSDGVSADFSYLRARFETFSELVSVVRLLRNITMDPGTDRAWTYQLLFPIGPAALYEALGEKANGFERTRVLFTRTGEFAYLMLTRASPPLRDKIRRHLAPFFEADAARNRLVMRLISTPEPDRGNTKGGTYLPYKSHPAFERMAEDVAAILSLKLSDQDALQYLQPLLGLHLYLYGIETANNYLGRTGLPPIVCEILAPRSDLVRKSAVRSYLDNDSLGAMAVRRFVDQIGLSDPELVAKLADVTLDHRAKTEYLAGHLSRSLSLKKEMRAIEPTAFIQELHSFAQSNYWDGTGDGLTALAVGCGLVSKRQTNRYRYAPTDDLLRALALANVSSPVEEGEYLRHLRKRYHIAIAPAEAKLAVSDSLFDDGEFQRNRERFTQHLIGMGLAYRMSDSCTYVINPMESRE